MRTRLLGVYAGPLVLMAVAAFGERTEIRVRKGTVVAETPRSGRVGIDAGQKVILTRDRHPIIAVDDPLVDDVMEIYRWVEAEKQAGRESIVSSGIQVLRIDSERAIKCTWLSEGTNSGAEPMKEIQRGPTVILKDPKYYDMEGNLLPFELEKINPRSGIYRLKLSRPIPSGDAFRFIGVCEEIDNAVFGRDGPLRLVRINYGSAPERLYYYRFILPTSAVFVDSSQPPTMIDSADGRVAVTIRNYTGAGGDGVSIAFLWPDKDDTTVADVPPRYRGLRDRDEQEIVEAGRLETAKILAGDTYDKQGTPLETLLSLYSAAVHSDSGGFLDLVSPDLRELASGQIDQIMGLAGRVVDYEFLGMPEDWPENPNDGYEHPVYLCRRGSLLCEATLVMVYQGGTWYLAGLEAGRRGEPSSGAPVARSAGGVTVSTAQGHLGDATYDGLQPGRFMRRWLFLGPIDVPWGGEGYFPDEKTSDAFFDMESFNLNRFEPQVGVGAEDVDWRPLHSEYGVIDLTRAFDSWFAVAYAWAQVDMPEVTHGVLGIGSDDCIKVWLNGQLVHRHVGGRGVFPDSDRVPVTFKQGKNQLVLKILNYGGPWGFSCRLLDP
jgi:hypothetical protein